jgi:hypothetical protein
MAKKYTLIVILAVVLGLAAFVLFYRQTDGFQDGATDPTLIKIFGNLLETYNMVLGKVTEMGIQSRPVEGTTLENYIRDQLATLQKLGETCSTTICTEAQIKDPNLLTAYRTANTVGELGLPDISFETLAVDSPDASGGAAVQQPEGAAPEPSTQAPDTQLPAAQMPASVLTQGSKPSLDECKKHYTCNISANMA